MISVDLSNVESIESSNHLYQWDKGQQLEIKGLGVSKAPEIHFGVNGSMLAIVVNSTLSGGIVYADIPNEILMSGKDLRVYVHIDGTTIKNILIPVFKRNMPENYVVDSSNVTWIEEFETEANEITTAKCNEIEAKGTSTLESIPDDYTALSNEVTNLKSDLNNTIYSEELINKTIAVNNSGFVESATANIKKGEIIRFTMITDKPVTMFYQVYYTDGSTIDYDLNVNKYMMSFDHVVTKPVNTVRVYRNGQIWSDVDIKVERISSIDVVSNKLGKDISKLDTVTSGFITAYMDVTNCITTIAGKHITKNGVENAQNNNWKLDVYDVSSYKGLVHIKAYTRFVGDYAWSVCSDKNLSVITKLSASYNETNEFASFAEYMDIGADDKYLVVQTYNNNSTVKKIYESGEYHDFKKNCNRIVNNGIYSKASVISKSGDMVSIVDDGFNEFGDMTKKIIINGTTDAYFYAELEKPVPVTDVESVTIRMKLPLYTTVANGIHAGYFGVAPKTDEQGTPAPVYYKVYSNSNFSYGEYTCKIPRSAFITDYFTGNLNGISFRAIPRNNVSEWYGGWTLVDIQVNQRMKPCILLNFDQVWKESIDNGAYDMLHSKNIKYTMFTAGYENKPDYTIAELKLMEQFGNEISEYGGLVFGDNLPASEVMKIVDDGIVDLADITDKPMYSYGCRQHNGNSKLVNLLRMRGVKAIRMNQNLFPIGNFTKNDYVIPAIEITDQTSASAIIAKIDECIVNGSCLPLFTHGVCATGQKYMKFDDGSSSTSEGVPLDKFTTIINHIKSKMDAGEIECLTFADFVKSCY